MKSKPAAKKIKKSKNNTVKKMARKSTTKVSPIPKGYQSITPCLIVSNASDAIEFYKKIFGAKEVLRIQHPNGKISHAELNIGNAKIMLADASPGRETRAPESYGGSPVAIHLYIKNVDDVVTRAVAAGAKLIKPLKNMFYGDRNASLEDPFGHKWYVATHIENVTLAKVRKRAAELFSESSY